MSLVIKNMFRKERNDKKMLIGSLLRSQVISAAGLE